MQECKDITPKDKDGNKHGYWEQYYDNGQLSYKGTFHHGQRHGYWESYYSDGNIFYKGTYHRGEPIGYWRLVNNTEYYARM